MTPAQLSRAVLRTVTRAVEDGELGVAVPERVMVRGAPRDSRGDYATNVALRLAQRAGCPAREVAEVLRTRLAREAGIAGVEVSGPGFLTVTVTGGARAELVARLIREGAGRTGGARCHPGRDAERWAAATGRVRGDIAGLLVQRESNPLFRVQYAHARIRALLRNARDLGFAADPHGAGYGEPVEAGLLGLLADHHRVSAAGDPGRLARQLHSVATAFFRFHDVQPALPRGDEKPGAVHRARLALAQATGTVLADGLDRLGVTAPEHL